MGIQGLKRVCVLAAACTITPAVAGTISTAWNPVTYSDLAGYRVVYGTSPGLYSGSQDVGVVTSATLAGLDNCTTYYVAVKARALDGGLSASFSNEISGYARPILTAVAPQIAQRGSTTSIVVTGANFASGASLVFDSPNIDVNSVSVNSCTQLSATITVGGAAATGAIRLEVRNPDGTYGYSSGLLTIMSAAAPQVLSVYPPNGSPHIPVVVQPTVVFSKAMNPATITSATVTLLDTAGNSVAQAAGSPWLSADGRIATIDPAPNVAFGSTYRVRVRGGSSGVKDAAGSAMMSDFIQVPGFTTRSDTTTVPIVISVSPPSLSVGVSVSVRPTVSFNEAMDASTIDSSSVALLDVFENVIPQAAGSPSLSANQKIVTIIPADDLVPNLGHRIRVYGGSAGVKDQMGTSLAATFVQVPGFTTALDGATPPTILTVTPPTSSVNVPVNVTPTVKFSEPMQRSTITDSTVLLLDPEGNPVDQVSGSPMLSADGATATIIPSSHLEFSSRYRIRVIGGSSGVQDLSGDSLESTFTTPVAGFLTMADAVGSPRVASVVPPSLATGVPLNVRPVVSFTEPMDPSTITQTTVQLLDSSGRSIAQTSGSPFLSTDGISATIVPAANLAYSSSYRVRALSGVAGVRDLSGDPLPATYTQASGFTTVDDDAAPVLSAVRATPQSTSAQILWTTNEAADSRVLYRKDIQVRFQRPVGESARVTSHTLLVWGLTPSTRYAFYVESEDGAGNLVASDEVFFTTLPNDYSYVAFEAESDLETLPIRASAGPLAFRGGYIETIPFTPTGRLTEPSGTSELSFYVPTDGTWFVWLRLYGPTATSNSWFESVDGAPRRPVAPPVTGSWEWALARSYPLTSGLHVLELGGHEAQARVDRVLITNDPTFGATEQPDFYFLPPDGPIALTAITGGESNTLRWTNPTGDVNAIVIRYRTDGTYPGNPSDGYPALSRAATEGTSESFLHTDLTNYTTYRYSVFVVDASGNASDAAKAAATPTP